MLSELFVQARLISPVFFLTGQVLVGIYQVCEKWLKDRRGQVLNYADICHYQKVAAALGETGRLIKAVNEVIEGGGDWPMRQYGSGEGVIAKGKSIKLKVGRDEGIIGTRD